MGRFNEASKAAYDFGIGFSSEGWAHTERIFTAVGDAVDAYFGQVTPLEARKTLIAYYGVATGRRPFVDRPDDLRDAEKLEAALVQVKKQFPRFGAPLTDLAYIRPDDPAQPRELGWINYWSARTCEYLGFPDPERDRDLLAYSYRTPASAWLVKLCAEPLDLSRADHLTTLADTYARFPKLGLSALRKAASAPSGIEFPQNTAFIQESNLWHVIERLVPMLRQRGFQVVERAPKSTQCLTIGLFPGAPDWTVIKTMPANFLAEKTPGSDEPRLNALCQAVERGGFMLNVYGRTEADVMGSDKSGRAREAPLVLIELDVLDVDDYGQLAQQVYADLAGKNADLCDNERFAESLDGKALQERQGVTLRFSPM